MEYRETPLCFDCEGSTLVGVLAMPSAATSLGVIVVVGGPQYRVGSHRQFVLLARMLAGAGIACLRFDYRGMGDSEGDPVAFDATGPDIEAAVAAIRGRLPDVRTLVLWGLCDGAAACAIAGPQPGVAGLILVNPWVRTDEGLAESTLKNYYGRRIGRRDFWRKLLAGRIDIVASLRGFLRTLADVARKRNPSTGSLPARIARGIADHRGPVLVMLSGNDQVAAEFVLAAQRNGSLRKALRQPVVSRIGLPGADHTLSSRRSHEDAMVAILAWLRAAFPTAGLVGATAAGCQ
jgi:exosortase A-associated hydrolase 1